MLRPASTPPRTATLILLAGLAVVTLNMILPSLPAMAREFGVDYAVIALAFSAYLAISAVLQLVFGPLSDRFGRRPVLLCAMAVFACASLGCALAQDVVSFLICRVLQAAVISGAALSQAIVRDQLPPQEAASRLGSIASVWAVAPMLGPVLGGVLDGLVGWRASFWAFTCVGMAMWLLIWADLGETNTRRTASIGAQFRSYPMLLRTPVYWAYAVYIACSVGAFYAFLAGAVLVAETSFAMPTALLGVAMGSITAGFIFGSFVAGRVSRRFRLSTMMIAGRSVALAGILIVLMLVAAGLLHPLIYFAAAVATGIGNGLSMPSANSGAMSVRPELAGSAAGMTGALTVATGAVISQLVGHMLTPQNGAVMLLVIMAGITGIALTASLLARVIEVRAATALP